MATNGLQRTSFCRSTRRLRTRPWCIFRTLYKGLYERRLGAPTSGPNAQRDLIIQQMKDLQRADIDRNRLAYFGVSYGARLGPISLVAEKTV
jgi:hypothetical protein